MSDDVSLRCRNREVFQLVMGNTIEPVLPYQLQWVAHWTQASSSLSLQSNKHCAGTNASKDQIGHCYIPIETMKPSYTYECKNGWRCDLGKQDPTSYMLQSLEAQGGDNGRYTIINNFVLNRSDFQTLEKLPEHKDPASSINWENIIPYHFQNSNNPTSEWTHFPMFDINRKLETILNPKKRTSFDNMEAKMNEQLFSLRESPLPTHLTEFASERQHQQQNITHIDEEMRPYGSVEGLPHYKKCHTPNMTSSMQNDEENDPFCSGLAFKEHFANASLSYLKDNTVCFGSSGARMKDGSGSCSGCVPHSRAAEECSEERGIACGRNRTTPGPSKSNRVSYCSTSGSRKGESEKFSSGSKHFPITKEVGRELCRRDKIAGGSTVSSNVKGTAFFEKVTLPGFLHHHGQHEKNLQNLVSSTNNLEVEGIDTQFMEKENESLVITNPIHVDLHGKPGSPEVGSSFELQKIPQDVVHPNLKRTDIAVTDTSGSESTGTLSRKTSNPPAERTQNDSEQSLMWVKRLRPSSLDPIPLGTKRFKVGDGSSSAEKQNLCAKVVNYNRSISELPGCQQIDKTTFLPKSDECSAGDSEKVIPWIRRWRRSSQETASLTPGLCEPEKTKESPEKFEAKQFPSLAAMALMGKQVTNYRPRGATAEVGIYKLARRYKLAEGKSGRMFLLDCQFATHRQSMPL